MRRWCLHVVGLVVPHGHERRPPGREAPLQAVLVSVQQGEVARVEVPLDIDECQAAVTKLLRPGPRNGGDRAGRDYSVVGSVVGQTVRAVLGGERWVQSNGGEAFPRQADELGIDVD